MCIIVWICAYCICLKTHFGLMQAVLYCRTGSCKNCTAAPTSLPLLAGVNRECPDQPRRVPLLKCLTKFRDFVIGQVWPQGWIVILQALQLVWAFIPSIWQNCLFHELHICLCKNFSPVSHLFRFCESHLDEMIQLATLSTLQSKIFRYTFANSVDLDELTCYEPSHQDLHCLSVLEVWMTPLLQ